MAHQHLGDFGDFSLWAVVTSPPWYENCYFVRHHPSESLVIVDPGGDAESLAEAARAIGGRVVALWLTHGHPDHLGAAAALETVFAVDTRAYAPESAVIARAGDLARSFTGHTLAGPARLVPFAEPPAEALDGVPVRVIATPGHSPGGVCYDFGAFVLTGDTLFRQGVGRTDLPGGSEEQLWDSIARLLDLLGEDAMLFSGHGPEWSARDARRWWSMVG